MKNKVAAQLRSGSPGSPGCSPRFHQVYGRQVHVPQRQKETTKKNIENCCLAALWGLLAQPSEITGMLEGTLFC